MKVKGLNKVVSDSKCLNGNAYLQVVFDSENKEVWAVWHTGFYVNFQTYYENPKIVTLFNTFEKVTRKQILESIGNLE